MALKVVLKLRWITMSLFLNETVFFFQFDLSSWHEYLNLKPLCVLLFLRHHLWQSDWGKVSIDLLMYIYFYVKNGLTLTLATLLLILKKCNFEIAQIDPCINSTLNICPVSDFLTLFSTAEPLHPVEETYFGWLVHCNCISFILPLLGSLICKSIPLLLGFGE